MEGCAGFEPSKAGHELDVLAERLAQHNEERYKEAFMLVAYGRLTQQFLGRESSLYSILEMPCILQAARKLRGVSPFLRCLTTVESGVWRLRIAIISFCHPAKACKVSDLPLALYFLMHN